MPAARSSTEKDSGMMVDSDGALRRTNSALSARGSWFLKRGAICFVALLLLATARGANGQAKKTGEAAVSAEAKEIIAQELLLQRYEIEFNFAGMEKLMLPDFIELSESIKNRDQVLAGLRRVSESGCRVQPIKMKNARVAFLSPEIATLVYSATQTGTCYSQSLTINANVATLWVRRDGRWQAEVRSELIAGT
jgi:hypothetical protein